MVPLSRRPSKRRPPLDAAACRVLSPLEPRPVVRKWRGHVNVPNGPRAGRHLGELALAGASELRGIAQPVTAHFCERRITVTAAPFPHRRPDPPGAPFSPPPEAIRRDSERRKVSCARLLRAPTDEDRRKSIGRWEHSASVSLAVTLVGGWGLPETAFSPHRAAALRRSPRTTGGWISAQAGRP